MSQWAGGVLTAAGRALQAKVEAGATALVLTKIKLGDGTESMDAVDNLTDLVGPKAVLGISSSVADGDHATITGVVLSTQLQAGFRCREWGLFATDPDAGEILYMITIDAQPEWLPSSTAAAQVSATYAMNIAVANATNIEVQIDPAGLVDVEMLQSYMGLAKRSTAVALGDTAMLEGLPAMYFLECTTPGTTGDNTPVITSVTAGDTITNGSVVWTVRQCLPTSGGKLIGQTIQRNVSNDQLNIFGGNGINNGGSLILAGNTTADENFQGIFQLRAAKSQALAHILRGKPDGTLEWGTNNSFNDLGGAAIVAKSITGTSWYRKQADGLIVQGGKETQTVGTYNIACSFPISFNSTNYSAVAIVDTSYGGGGSGVENNPRNIYINTKSMDKVYFYVAPNSSPLTIYWLAVGY